tara:strand:- start:204 stop:416 length:213 start_codon:yes stop_codon:yes gene_type:complete
MEIYKESMKIMKKEAKKIETQRLRVEYNKKVISCDKCGTYIQQKNMTRHKKTMICRKIWDYSLLETDDEE